MAQSTIQGSTIALIGVAIIVIIRIDGIGNAIIIGVGTAFIDVGAAVVIYAITHLGGQTIDKYVQGSAISGIGISITIIIGIHTVFDAVAI